MGNDQRKKGAVLSYIVIILNTIIQIIYTPFLINNLGQSEYGLYSLVSSIIGYLTILDFGFGNAIIVYTAKYRAQNKIKEEQKLHGMFLRIFCVIGILAGILGLILCFNIPKMFGNTMSEIEIQKAKVMMLILSFNLVLTFSFNIYSSIITAYEKFTYQKIISIINILLSPILMTPMLLLGFKSICLTLIITFINMGIVLSNYLYCKNKLNIKIKYCGFDKAVFKQMLGYSIFIFIEVIVDKINGSIDQFILGAVSGTIAVSIYSVSLRISSMFTQFSTAISSVFLPKMSKMVVQDCSNEELTNEFIKVGRIQYYIIFLLCSGFILFGKEFIKFWIGENFITSYYVILLLIIPLSIPLVQNLGLSIMKAQNKYKFKAITSSMMAIVNLLMSIFLAKKYGPIGSALGTSISIFICEIILLNIYYRKSVGLNIYRFWSNISKITLAFSIPVVIILVIMKFVKLFGIISVIIYGSIYTIIYLISCYCISMNDYEKDIFRSLYLKLCRRK